MKNFLLQVKENVREMLSNGQTTVFTIATTSKQEEKAYVTPKRSASGFVVSGCVVFDQSVVLKIIEIIDGKVDIILVDTEKKIPLRVHDSISGQENDIYNSPRTIGLVETGNLSKLCFNNVKKSKIFEFKANDLTVNATWSFLSQKLHFLSGKKIAIIGAGNIGCKLALKLVECGAEVHIHRRNSYKGNTITQGLNFIKPENTVANIVFQEKVLQASFLADVLIGASNGVQVINDDIIKSIKRTALIVDLGKNNLTPTAIDFAVQMKIEIVRSDITSALEGFIYEVIKMDSLLTNSYGIRELDYCRIVGGGYFGACGDIIVDRIDKPSKIIGVSAGNGSLKNELSESDIDNISRFKKEINYV